MGYITCMSVIVISIETSIRCILEEMKTPQMHGIDYFKGAGPKNHYLFRNVQVGHYILSLFVQAR